MKIVLAFDSFKGCMTAREACHAGAETIRQHIDGCEVIEMPMSDGGEGMVACIEQILPCDRIALKAHGPLMEEIEASYIISDDGRTAYMEMAETCGLTLVPKEKRNPMLTTTYGVGDMIADAVSHGCDNIIIGIGGSSTCDGGRGMVESLRDKGFDFKREDLPHVTVACDVQNPLYGNNGAAFVFAPQKGATPEQVELLDRRLRDFAHETETAGYATSLSSIPGTGAAGGLAYGLYTYLKAELKSGIDLMLDLASFDSYLQDTDIVITGEGKSDCQTLMGKVADGVRKRCQKINVPVWLLSGQIEDAEGKLEQSFSVVKCINEGDLRPINELLDRNNAMQNLSRTIIDCLFRIRPSTEADIPQMQTVFGEAKEKMRLSGNMNQWADGYPSDDILRNDIHRGFSYVVEIGSSIIATFVLAICEDPTYKTIYGGHWIDDAKPYGTIHRIGSRKGYHDIMSIVLRFAYSMIDNIRIDTHRDNSPMKHLLEKYGFHYCGIIYLLNGDERLAYQRLKNHIQ